MGWNNTHSEHLQGIKDQKGEQCPQTAPAIEIKVLFKPTS